MKLSDQITLLTDILIEYGYDIEEGESAGEAAASVIRELEQATIDQKVVIEELRAQVESGVSADGLCDSCRYLRDGNLPRLCHNDEARRQGFSRRGYSVKAGHGCEEWAG